MLKWKVDYINWNRHYPIVQNNDQCLASRQRDAVAAAAAPGITRTLYADCVAALIAAAEQAI